MSLAWARRGAGKGQNCHHWYKMVWRIVAVERRGVFFLID
jgi:hypothetical protein